MRILIVEDNEAVRSAIRRALTARGHQIVEASTAAEGRMGVTDDIEAIVLDVNLPDGSGFDVCRTLRETGVQTPILMLTARDAVADRVEGLDAGADDYLVKPFAFQELLARLEAIHRRSGARPAPTSEAAGLKLDLTNRRVVHQATEIDLTPTEFSLLEFLMRHADRVVTRKMLCEHLWDADWEGETNVIEVHINRLRGKLDKEREDSFIQTIRGRGYALAIE
jgi:two-component system OmpR family response regulator/two-component system copper resistance phosphate regulon response regulator CusR